MSPRDTAPKDDLSDPDLGDDVYARAWTAMSKIQGRELDKVPYVTIESALGLVSTALGVLATYWPVLEAVRAAVDLTKSVIVTKADVRKRIAGLRLMQADMLCSLFGLRDFKDDGLVVNGQTFPGRLHVLCDHIKNDVKQFGNVMENYVNENWLGRLLKEKGWKEAIAKCGELVEKRKKEVLEVMAFYTARRADQLVASIDLSLAPISKIAIQVEALQALFVPAPEEDRVLQEVDRLGGAAACLQSETKLNDLAALMPDDEDAAARRGAKDKRAKLSAAELRRIRTPVEQLLEKNLARFESKIDFLVDKAKRERHTFRLIRKLAGARPYERIENPDIRKLWKEMGWGGSIDSHTFVLNLYDYFIDIGREFHARQGTIVPATTRLTSPQSPVTPSITLDIPRAASPAPSDAGTEDHDEFEGCTTPAAAADDEWCLNYFNYSTLFTFMEVLDDDMNGLVKIKEVNDFTSAIPEGITLMQWIAYCAYGWLVAAHIYRLRLDFITERMLEVDYAKENSQPVATYLTSLRWIAPCLRSMGEPELEDQRLLKVTHIVMRSQEQRLEGVLAVLHYDLEWEEARSILDYGFRGGPRAIGRIESRIFPVLFLIMQQHHRWLSLCQTHVIEESVLERAAHTIDVVTDLVFERAARLRDNFAKQQSDVNRKIQYVANGMYNEAHIYLTAPDNTQRSSMVDKWCLRWIHSIHVPSALQEYDPEFWLDTSPNDRQLPESKAVRRLIVSASGVDEGYEQVALYRAQYGITLVSGVAEACAPPEDVEHSNGGNDDTLDDLVVHDGIQCDGCMTYPVVGVRYKCIDCYDFDYCSTCYSTFPPPLKHPAALEGHHRPSHRFLRIERHGQGYVFDTINFALRETSLDLAHPEILLNLDTLIEHCLTAPLAVVEKLSGALKAFRKVCLEEPIDRDAEYAQAHDVLIPEFAVLPAAAEWAMSKARLLYLMREDHKRAHYCVCDGTDCDAGIDEDWKVRGDRYRCIDCFDFDYCTTCFDLNRTKHEDGSHRFVLIRYPCGSVIIERVFAQFKSGPDDPWTLNTGHVEPAPPSPLDEDDQGGVNSNDALPGKDTYVDGAENQAEVARSEEDGPPLCHGLCRRPLATVEGHKYRCLTCKMAPTSDVAAEYLLCHDCAFATAKWDEHSPTHVLAVITADASRAASERSANVDPAQEPQEVADVVTIENLSKRMDKMEEDMAALLSMVGKLHEMILTSSEGRTLPS